MLRDYQKNAVDACVSFFKYRAGRNGYVVSPGGSGKSHMISALAEAIYCMGGATVVVLARSEKLLTQNKSKFQPQYQDKIGIYCAGLGEKNITQPIIIASAQSIANQSIPNVAAIIVDECDEISDDEESQYQSFFAACGNPPILGFTATPFRTGSGNISWGEEILNIPLKSIMDAGFLTPPTNKVGAALDLSGVSVRLGEYVQAELEKIYDDPKLLELSIQKIKQYSAERSSILIFCQSLKHADILAFSMEENGMPCTIVSGDTDKEELSWILEDFERGNIKYLINVMLLTRGYDMPCVDMIAVLRATKSKRLWEQILYRGTRLKEGKKNFLVLDMGNNFAEHGPLGSPYKGKAGREQKASVGKICPSCEEFMPIAVQQCPECNYEWPEPEIKKITHEYEADSTSQTVYAGSGSDIVKYRVEDVTYKEKKSKNGNSMIVVSYHCGYGKYGTIADFLLPHHASDFVTSKVLRFMRDRGKDMMPPLSGYSMEDLLWHCQFLKKPKTITVDHREEFPRIIHYDFNEPAPELDDEIVW